MTGTRPRKSSKVCGASFPNRITLSYVASSGSLLFLATPGAPFWTRASACTSDGGSASRRESSKVVIGRSPDGDLGQQGVIIAVNQPLQVGNLRIGVEPRDCVPCHRCHNPRERGGQVQRGIVEVT